MITKFNKFTENIMKHKDLTNAFDEDSLQESIVVEFNISKDFLYKKVYSEYLLSLDVFDNINENTSYVIDMIKNGEFEEQSIGLPELFLESLNSTSRSGFLTPYTISDLGDMDLFKLKGLNIGFAIKGGDIISVHNNENSVRGIGRELLKQCVAKGGRKLDHFDGYLTGFYKSMGFVEVKEKRLYWDNQYQPMDWKHEPINIFDSSTSVFHDELPTDHNEYTDLQKIAIENYNTGKPCVIFRELDI